MKQALGRSYAIPDGVDEEDLEAELACLEDDLEGEDLFESTAVPDAPDRCRQMNTDCFRRRFVRATSFYFKVKLRTTKSISCV